MKIFTTMLLYQYREDAIRELIKNSLDACNVRFEQDPLINRRIGIELNKEDHIMIVSDNGAGMDVNDLKNFL